MTEPFSAVNVTKLDTKSANGNQFFRLIDPFSWTHDSVTYTVSENFITDFATIPGLLSGILDPRDERYARAAVIHDWLCYLVRRAMPEPGGGKVMTYRRADDLFFAAMRDCGASYLYAFSFWFAIRRRHKAMQAVGKIKP